MVATYAESLAQEAGADGVGYIATAPLADEGNSGGGLAAEPEQPERIAWRPVLSEGRRRPGGDRRGGQADGRGAKRRRDGPVIDIDNLRQGITRSPKARILRQQGRHRPLRVATCPSQCRPVPFGLVGESDAARPRFGSMIVALERTQLGRGHPRGVTCRSCTAAKKKKKKKQLAASAET